MASNAIHPALLVCAVSGILFMLFVYTLLSTQPFFVKGVDDVEQAQNNALGAMIALFVSLFLCSLCGILKNSRAVIGDINGLSMAPSSSQTMLGQSRSSIPSYNRLNVNLDYPSVTGGEH